MRKIIYIVGMSLVFSLGLEAQSSEKDSVEVYHEWGLNMTGLLNQVVPFKQVTNRTGPYSVSYKRIKGKNAFRAGFGMHFLTPDFFDTREEIRNFNFRVGYEFRRNVTEKIMFYHNYDFMIMAGNFNSPINDFSDDENAGIGFGLGLGISYDIAENLSLSTESTGFIGLVGGAGTIFSVTVLPPISIFLNYRF